MDNSKYKKCEHNKCKEYCIPCNGSALCQHNKRKSRCKECEGNSLCEHKKEKSACVQCGGTSICIHKIRKIYCKKCDGSGLCIHDKRKYQCLECKGSSICEHGTRKATCKKCHGSGVCQHNIDTSRCVPCGGVNVCIHGKQKRRCKECDGRDLCKTPLCEVRGIPKYNGYCLTCCIHIFPDIPVTNNYKTKEKETVDSVKETFPNLTWVCDKQIKEGCSKRRPDMLLDLGSHIIIIEVDENKHTDYDCSCEHKRLMELSKDVNFRSIVFIRFNPDAYILEDKTITSCWGQNGNGLLVIKKSKQKEWKQRIKILKEQIQYWIDNPSEKTIEIVELFY